MCPVAFGWRIVSILLTHGATQRPALLRVSGMLSQCDYLIAFSHIEMMIKENVMLVTMLSAV